jgi:hypothetical protein
MHAAETGLSYCSEIHCELVRTTESKLLVFQAIVPIVPCLRCPSYQVSRRAGSLIWGTDGGGPLILFFSLLPDADRGIGGDPLVCFLHRSHRFHWLEGVVFPWLVAALCRFLPKSDLPLTPAP